MSQQWFVEEPHGIAGPLPASQLKALAANGKISATTRVRLGIEGEWVHANRVKGLEFVLSHANLTSSPNSSVPAANPKPAARLPVTVNEGNASDAVDNRLTLGDWSFLRLLIFMTIAFLAGGTLLRIWSRSGNSWFAAILFWPYLAIVVAAFYSLFKARTQVLKNGHAETWFGLQLVAWEPNQGVLFLKNKRLAKAVDANGAGGGIVMLLTFLGEELGFRAPLEVRTTKFEDRDVLTREYVPITVKGAVFWRIVNLHRFYLNVSRTVHEVDDRGKQKAVAGFDAFDATGGGIIRSGTVFQLQAGEEWLRLIAEETTRAEVLKVRTGLLVVNQIAADLPDNLRSLSDEGNYESATNSLADAINAKMDESLSAYGIEVQRVSLQEARLPEDIHRKAVAACVSAYQPTLAKNEALASQITGRAVAANRNALLQSEASVIGADAVAKKEVLSNVPHHTYPPHLGNLLEVVSGFFDKDQKTSPPTNATTS